MRVYSMCSCRLDEFTQRQCGDFQRCIFSTEHISMLDSKASGVFLAQLHPPLVARFTLEVTGVES